MQIFKDKTFVTGIVYPKVKDSIIVKDDSSQAKKILDGHSFDIDWEEKKIINLKETDLSKEKERFRQLEKEIREIIKDLKIGDLKTKEQKVLYYLLIKHFKVEQMELTKNQIYGEQK